MTRAIWQEGEECTGWDTGNKRRTRSKIRCKETLRYDRAIKAEIDWLQLRPFSSKNHFTVCNDGLRVYEPRGLDGQWISNRVVPAEARS
jgi:hypothetical protein